MPACLFIAEMYLGGFGAGILLHADDVGVAVFYIIQDGVLSVLFLHVPKGHDVVRKEFVLFPVVRAVPGLTGI